MLNSENNVSLAPLAPTGLALGALGMLVALAWAVPLIAVGIQQGLVKMQPWLTLGMGR